MVELSVHEDHDRTEELITVINTAPPEPRVTPEAEAALREGWSLLDKEAADLEAAQKAKAKSDYDKRFEHAVMEEARRIVAQVIRTNAAKMNEVIEANMREIMGERLTEIENKLRNEMDRRVSKLHSDFLELDRQSRPAFLDAMEEISRPCFNASLSPTTSSE
jgi:alanyl-tRNA synthetase